MACSLQEREDQKQSETVGLTQEGKVSFEGDMKNGNPMETGPLSFLTDDQDGRVLKKRESATALSPCGIRMEKEKWKGITKKEKSMDFPRCGT